MTVEWYAAVIIPIGIFLWLGGSVLDSLVFMLFLSLFGGGAAFLIGKSTILPTSLGLVMLLAHLLLTMFKRSSHFVLGVRLNIYLAFYCIYGAVTAFLLPKIFHNRMDVPPMLMNGMKEFYVTVPLHFTSQNLTTAIYLIGTLLASVCAVAATVDPKSGRTIVRWAIIISWVHIGFGLMDSVFKTVGGDKIIHLFRNASYAELDQTENGLVRIAGTFPESSAYASFAFIWFVFMVELWLREIEPRLAGLTAVALGVMLVACTSTTGYVALALYAVVLFVRWVVDPSSLRLGKILPLAMVALAGVTVALALFAFFPHLVSAVTRALHTLTVGKLNTASGQQRLYWVHTGITAFERTYGLGIGAGSFRSSGLLFAILGCTGVVGLVAFTAHCVKVLQPLKAATYRLPGDREALGVAMAWTTCAGLLPAFAAAPSPDPGVVFGVMSGLALGWRYLAREAPAAAMAGRRPRPIFGVAGAARAQ